MPVTRNVQAKQGDVLVLVGTTKGAFVLRSNARRQRWDLGGPYFPGRERYALARVPPGAGGQCLHTILPHPTDRDRTTVAMSTGGVYRTDDAGASWWARNQGVRAEFMPDKYP